MKMPGGQASFELPAPRRGEGVEFGLATGVRLSPPGAQQPLLLEAPEGRIQGSLFDREDTFGGVANATRYRVAVHRLAAEGLEDQNVKGAL